MKKEETPPAPIAQFKDFSMDSSWVNGTVDRFTFEAKLFDNPSCFGINDGRVSKLNIANAMGRWVVNYDRGWDIKPAAAHKPYFDAVMKLLEASPRRFDSENQPLNQKPLQHESSTH